MQLYGLQFAVEVNVMKFLFKYIYNFLNIICIYIIMKFILIIFVVMCVLTYLIFKSDSDAFPFMDHSTSELVAFILLPILSQILLINILTRMYGKFNIWLVPLYSSIILFIIQILCFVMLYKYTDKYKYSPPLGDSIVVPIFLFWTTVYIYKTYIH